jgi:type IV pilus assembly protein PilX
MRAHSPPAQRGAALAVALMMLTVLLMLGIAAVDIGLQSERMGRNRYDRQIAWEAAEAALLDAEYDIGHPAAPRHALFGMARPETIAACDNGAAAGLCLPAADARRAVWRRMGPADGAPGVRYGRYSGRTMQAGVGAQPAHRPRYLIEILPHSAAGAPISEERLYRISALGFGPDDDTRVMLQSVYRRRLKPGAAPSARIGWREISPWEPV